MNAGAASMAVAMPVLTAYLMLWSWRRSPNVHRDILNLRQGERPAGDGVCAVSGAWGRTLGNEYAIRDLCVVNIPAVPRASVQSDRAGGGINDARSYIFFCGAPWTTY